MSHGVPMDPPKANPQRLLAICQVGIAHAAQRRSQALACCQPVPSFLQGRVDEAFFEPLPEDELERWG